MARHGAETRCLLSVYVDLHNGVCWSVFSIMSACVRFAPYGSMICYTRVSLSLRRRRGPCARLAKNGAALASKPTLPKCRQIPALTSGPRMEAEGPPESREAERRESAAPKVVSAANPAVGAAPVFVWKSHTSRGRSTRTEPSKPPAGHGAHSHSPKHGAARRSHSPKRSSPRRARARPRASLSSSGSSRPMRMWPR